MSKSKSKKKVKFKIKKTQKTLLFLVLFLLVALILIFTRSQIHTECGEETHTGDCCTFRGFGFNALDTLKHTSQPPPTPPAWRGDMDVASRIPTIGGRWEIAPTYTTNTNNRSSI